MRLFAYGTLRDPDIQLWLWGRKQKGTLAVLPGYRLGQYPSGIKYIVPDADSKVLGMVYEVTAGDLYETDRYEGRAYDRIEATVNGQPTWVYVRA